MNRTRMEYKSLGAAVSGCRSLMWMACCTFLMFMCVGVRLSAATTEAKPRISRARAGVLLEVCEAQTFHASCGPSEVIIMREARYGRMRAGRCVLRDYGHVGCAAEVLPQMDAMCSGRRECEVRIPHLSLDSVSPCPSDLKTFLEVKYECIRVSSPQCHACGFFNHSAIVSGPAGHLASDSVTTVGCGTRLCPWRIQEAPGRHINLTLIDFSLSSSVSSRAIPEAASSASAAGGGGNGQGEASEGHYYRMAGDDPGNGCTRLATIREPGRPGTLPICSDGHQRERLVYTSRGEAVEILLDPAYSVPSHQASEGPRFLLRYQAFGCPDIEAPPNAWLKRSGDTTVIGCSSSQDTYHVTCHGNQWQGSIGACPETMASRGSDVFPDEPHSTGVMVAIAIGIALVVGSLVVTIGLVYIRRRGLPPGGAVHAVEPTYPFPVQRILMNPKGGPEYCYPQELLPCYQTIVAPRENDYEFTMELRPLPNVPQERLRPTLVHSFSDAGRCCPAHDDQPRRAYSFSTFRPLAPPGECFYNRAEQCGGSLARGAANTGGSRSPLHHYFELDPEQTGSGGEEEVDVEVLGRMLPGSLPPASSGTESAASREENENRTNSGRELGRHCPRQTSFQSVLSPRALCQASDFMSLGYLDRRDDNKFSWP